MSFLTDLLNPESQETTPHTDENAVQALAALSAVGHDSSQLLQAPDAHMDATTAAQHLQDNREPAYTRQDPTTSQIRQAPESQPPKADLAHAHITSLKHEHSSRTRSPLRESSVPVPSTETPSTTTTTTNPRKRPAPKSAMKKGTASTVKREATAKRKPDSVSKSKSKSKPSAAKRAASNAGTPTGGSPGPRSVRTASSPPGSSPSAGVEEGDHASDNEEDEEQGTPDPDAELYCLCRRPDTGTFMIGCDGGCDDWFHGKCVGIAERDKGLIDRYICPRCEEKGIGTTTWKRMCRREGCRMSARVRGAESSKYCSDECGVRFMKDMLAKARKPAQNPAASKKSKKSAPEPGHDLGPRGGVLSAGELKTLLKSSRNLDEFKHLGDGVLSPPTTPPSSQGLDAQKPQHEESGLNDIERERIEHIGRTKETTRARHSLLKDRTKFITMLRQAANRAAEDRNVKPKEMCCYDQRVTWSEDQFSAWRESPEGKEALTSGVVQPGAEGEATEPCTKRKCLKHLDWAKLQLDDTRFEISENSEAMRALDKEEKEIRERAGLRLREIRAGGVGGTVEFHGQKLQDQDSKCPVQENDESSSPPAKETQKDETSVVAETKMDTSPDFEDGKKDVPPVLQEAQKNNPPTPEQIKDHEMSNVEETEKEIQPVVVVEEDLEKKDTLSAAVEHIEENAMHGIEETKNENISGIDESDGGDAIKIQQQQQQPVLSAEETQEQVPDLVQDTEMLDGDPTAAAAAAAA